MIARNLGETESEKKFCDSGTCVLVGGGEYVGSEGGLTKIFDRLRPDLAFKARIDGNEKTGLAFVDVGPAVVERDVENLRRRQTNADCDGSRRCSRQWLGQVG